jgi:hypothetical protein
MEITRRNRTELKAYFVKNSIPKESNFAELIDGMLNQKEDGIVKLPGDPLSLEAAGDDTSVKPLLNFYRSFRDPSPAWRLTLNPRSNPHDAGSARAGLNISDGAGQSRLFIDGTTGHVGIGTLTPGAKLDVYATSETHGWYEAIRFSQSRSAITLPSGGLLFGLHSDRNFYFVDIKEERQKNLMTIDANTGNVGIGPAGLVARLEVAVEATDDNTMPLFIGKGPSPHLTILNNGHVGIGTTMPAGRLEVAVAAGDAQTPPLVVKKGSEEYLRIRNDGAVDVLKGPLYVVGTVAAEAFEGSINASHILTGTLRSDCLPKQEDWHSVTLANAWVQFSDEYNPAQYFKDSQGIVHLRGLIKHSQLGSVRNNEFHNNLLVLFTLPEGYRPPYRQLHVVCTNVNEVGRIDVLSDGSVTMISGNFGWISLDSISFRAS